MSNTDKEAQLIAALRKAYADLKIDSSWALHSDMPEAALWKQAADALEARSSASSATQDAISRDAVVRLINEPQDLMYPTSQDWLIEQVRKLSAIALPPIEEVSSRVHEAWMASKRAQGVTTRKAEDGEELMVPYEQLSEKAKQLDRGTVRAVYAAMAR